MAMANIPTLGHRFILKQILFICCGLVLVIVAQADYDEGDYGYENYGDYDDNYTYDEDYTIDACDYHGSISESRACHKKNLPIKTMEELFGPNVRKCCRVHGYEESISSDCEDEKMKKYRGKHVCTDPNNPGHPEPFQTDTSCPTHCLKDRTLTIFENGTNADFYIDKKGHLIVNKTAAFQNMNVENYCVTYHCNEDVGDDGVWMVHLKSCLCMKNDSEIFHQLDQKVDASIPRCCGGDLEEMSSQCSKTPIIINTDASDSYKSFWPVGSQIVYQKMFKNETINKDATNYCVGPSWSHSNSFDYQNPIEMKLFILPEPCKGETPCLRTCCKPGEITIECKSPSKNNFSNPFDIYNPKIQGYHLEKAHRLERKCPKGYIHHVLEHEKCDGRFELINQTDQVILYQKENDKKYNASDFCLTFEEDQNWGAEICIKNPKEENRFDIYPYVLVVSCFFLLITLVIYTYYGKKLLNHYTRLMRHYTLVLFIAFLILAINQFINFKEVNQEFCIFNGYALQYLFLTTFAIMTCMSCELLMNLRGNASSNKRYRHEMLGGYGAPLIITLLTCIFQFYRPKCSIVNPRIGEYHCFFPSASFAKGLWFYLPIGIALSINACAFIFTVMKICSMDKKQREINMRSGKRNESMESVCSRFLMFVKLFMGMGFIWTFEIVAGLIGDSVSEEVWYVTDFLNMMQGLYIFLIFVMKRNVFETILGKKIRYYSPSINSQGNAVQMTRMKKKVQIVSHTRTNTQYSNVSTSGY